MIFHLIHTYTYIHTYIHYIHTYIQSLQSRAKKYVCCIHWYWAENTQHVSGFMRLVLSHHSVYSSFTFLSIKGRQHIDGYGQKGWSDPNNRAVMQHAITSFPSCSAKKKPAGISENTELRIVQTFLPESH
jgi:hypothetical protein